MPIDSIDNHNPPGDLGLVFENAKDALGIHVHEKGFDKHGFGEVGIFNFSIFSKSGKRSLMDFTHKCSYYRNALRDKEFIQYWVS